MKTTDYKVGDTVTLNDGNKYIYEGKPNGGGHRFRVIENSGFLLSTDEKGNFAPFLLKPSAEVEKPKKWYNKALDWWKASNRWKHFLYAIPLGAVCGAPFATGVGLGMEVKDHLYGNKADFVDFHLTAFGGAIGHGIMLVVGLDYVIGYLISLI